ncbi:tRNA-(ms[2]io[6]A)-hydroxylase [Fangia hongkongensis]|uniref:tRNA-(ms[2]io[6]A)-hydroxylase n=1 Tax=Fangia hongkongensis TaxID=270495 RepID=UPI00036BEBBC|nr:tRNA-(ms[2]io[6]A)-hydroxylase [Fangia hongkongensis]MBK2123983.1 tRNA-(ms[2]io[6]A)-hydroxylase [Fangia hongkongensis]
MQYHDYATIESFLPCSTPKAWVDKALQNQEILLIDHAHCEKKAASAAISFMYRKSTEYPDLLLRMSKIAREELVHFEQVLAILKKRNIRYRLLSESRYARTLRTLMRTSEEGRLVDTLIIGAFIEARSCERFSVIAPHLDEELQKFYQGLLASERRHFSIYLQFATEYSSEPIMPHIERFRVLEQELIESEDNEFRFHSGV